MEDNMCGTCEFCDNDGDKKPCLSCMQWVEGYLEATNYEPRKSVQID